MEKVMFWIRLQRQRSGALLRAALRTADAKLPVWRDRKAVTAIEYAIIAGVIVTVLVASVSRIGPELTPTFNTVSSEL